MMMASEDVWAAAQDNNNNNNNRVAVKKMMMEMDTDQESVGSMEEMDSPRSVAATAKGRKWNFKNNIDVVYVHSQILRIRAEDSHIGFDDAAEIFSVKDNKVAVSAAGHVTSAVVLLRPILPASPLGAAHTTITT